MNIISKENCMKVDFKVINKFDKYKYFLRNPISILGKAPKNRHGRVTGSTGIF